MSTKNIQGTGKAHPSPMTKSHSGLGSHKARFTSIPAAIAQAAGSGTKHAGQPPKSK